jgi:hypothetical protein
LPINKIEGGEMAWTDQPRALDPRLREIRLFVRAGALEGVNGVTCAGEDQRMIIDRDALTATVREIPELRHNDEARLANVHSCHVP